MNHLLIKNIGKLYGVLDESTTRLRGSEMSQLNFLPNSYLLIRDGLIHDFGSMGSLSETKDYEVYDAGQKNLLPCYCDSHTHIVFAEWRESEFVLRIKGHTYEEIAEAGGGILNSADRMNEASEDILFHSAMKRVNEMIQMGTGAIEIKSGYGLSTSSELKMLRVIKKIKQESPIAIKSTFLGAHAFPAIYKNNRKAYVDLICNEMLPKISDENLADYIDVFCDKGFFSPEETATILDAGIKYGLIPKIHANELDYSGGIQAGVAKKALSVDHLEFTGDEEIQCLLKSATMPTVLPSTAFFLKLPYAPARTMIDSGLPVALASDYNPGSSPSGSMPFVNALACIHMNLLPEEALNASTINSAYAMGLEKTHGSITRGKVGNVFLLKDGHDINHIPYAFTKQHIEQVIINGSLYNT